MYLGVVVVVCALGQAPAPVENVSTFAPRSAEAERKALHVPEGFEVQLVASEPEIQKPMNLAFDDRGRLWVTGSVEYPFPAPDGKRPRDGVRILEDFGDDGRARKVTTFADGLNIPIGLLPLPGGNGALVYSIPTIDRLTDRDGDGRADLREPLYQTFGSRDTHGMTNSFSWGFDGWFYACHGFANDSRVHGTDQATVQLQSGNVIRMKPDGRHAEFFTHGQVNPFGLSFDELGNLYSSDCHSKPLYQLLRGAYYPSFGKPDDGLGFGPEMIAHDHGSTAIDGATYYAADQFPEPYRGTLFIGNVVTNRINHDRIEWHGSSPRALAQPDFVWSEDNWFRPVDIELGPDGALYVADFYNRIIGHYEVPLTHPGRDHNHGRIWRIVYRGKDGNRRASMPRGDWTKATIKELLEDIGHPNLAVRTRASNQLADREDEHLDATLSAAVAKKEEPWRRIHALWLLQRRGRLDEPTLDGAARADDRRIRIHAFRVLGERPEWGDSLSQTARGGLHDGDPSVRRAAAEALGRHPESANIRPLLDARREVAADDTHLLHVVRMALRDQLLDPKSWGELASLAPTEAEARAIADVATGVPGPEAADFLLRHISRVTEPQENVVRYVHHIARHQRGEASAALFEFVRKQDKEGRLRQATLLRAIQQGTQERGAPVGKDLRALALELTTSLLDSKRGDEVPVGIALVGSFGLLEARGRLEAMAEGEGVPEGWRVEALATLAALDPKGELGLLGRLILDPAAPLGVRERAATLLSGMDRPEARGALIQALPTAPDRVQATIAAGLAMRKPGAEALLEAVATGKASARLLQEPRVAESLNRSGIAGVKGRLEGLLKGLPPADQRLKELLDRRRAAVRDARPDLESGSRIFKKNCAVCHQLEGQGAKVGPQLDGIGARGIDRLLEDVLDPGRNVDQAFRLTSLALKDGRIVSGLLLREEGAVLVLADAQGKEVRIPGDQVEERTTTQASPMPANFADQVSEADFNHLIAFLLSKAQASK